MSREGPTVFEREPDSPVVAVAAVAAAEGARGAASALACAGADVDRASLLVDLGGRPPRPTLLASSAARELEERLAAHLPAIRVAARGHVCHLAAPADEEGLAAASAAATVARGALAVVHSPPELLQVLLTAGPPIGGVLLRADLPADRPLVALVVHELLDRELDVAVLKHRLSWVDERRALFGVLGSESGGIPVSVRGKLLSHECYAGLRGPEADPARVA